MTLYYGDSAVSCGDTWCGDTECGDTWCSDTECGDTDLVVLGIETVTLMVNVLFPNRCSWSV